MIQANEIGYTFQDGKIALDSISLHIKEGEFVVLTGVTGCGKTTFLKCINSIIPYDASGKMTGELTVDGQNTALSSPQQLAQTVGYLFQSPDEQIFFTRVYEEMAFGLENYCFPVEEIEARIDWALSLVGMSTFKYADTNALSGGQKQRVVLASLIALKPKILLLDEPVSQLDPKGTQEVLKAIQQLKNEGITVVMVEHRLHEVMPFADRLVVMHEGKIKADVSAKEAPSLKPLFKEIGLRELTDMPPTIEYLIQKKQLNEMSRGQKNHKEPLLQFHNVSFSYEKKKLFSQHPQMILQAIDFEVYAGEVIAIVGENGSGKSTMMQLMAGLQKPSLGDVTISNKNTKKVNGYNLAGTVGIVFQYPALMLTCESVEHELCFGPKNKKVEKDLICERLFKTATALGLQHLLQQHPQTLSGGQRLRCATGSIVMMEPKILLLDEPTSGQDICHIESLLSWCKTYAALGNSVIFITHDIEMAEKYASRMVVIDKGEIIEDWYLNEE